MTAKTALPYEHLERATAGLRARLRHRLADLGATADWPTLAVTGPEAVRDGLGRTWFEYRG